MEGLQKALNSSSGKTQPPAPPPEATPTAVVEKPEPRRRTSREGKEYLGTWLKADFIASLRLVQLRRPRDGQGKKVYLDDLVAEALNDLFRKYDVPTVQHD